MGFRKNTRLQLRAIYTQICAARQSSNTKIENITKANGYLRKDIDNAWDMIHKLEKRIGDKRQRDKSDLWVRQWAGLLGAQFDQEPKDFSIQEQIDQLRDYLGLTYRATSAETKLVSTKKPVKKAVAKKVAKKK